MGYCTTLDLLKRFGAIELAQLSDHGIPTLVTADMLTTQLQHGDMSGYTSEEQAASVAAEVLIEQAIVDADVLIDSHLVGRYSLPLTQTVPILEKVASTLARHALYVSEPPRVVQTHYESMMKILASIARGDMSLGLDTSRELVSNQNPIKVRAATRVFSDELLSNY